MRNYFLFRNKKRLSHHAQFMLLLVTRSRMTTLEVALLITICFLQFHEKDEEREHNSSLTYLSQ